MCLFPIGLSLLIHFQQILWVLKLLLSTGKRPLGRPRRRWALGRPRRRWEDNIRMDFEEIGISAGNWVDSAQDRNYWRALVNAALNLRVS